MPNIDGLQVLKYMENKSHKAKFIVISADIKDETITECLLLGASDYLNKPFEKDDFLKVININL